MSSYSWRVEAGRLEGPLTAASLGDAARFLPEGAYTTLRSYGRTGLLRLEGHLARIEESARLLGHPVQLDRLALRRQLCEVLRGVPWPEGDETRLRLTLDCTRQPGDLWISVEPLTVPGEADYRDGVAVRTRAMRRDNPKAKHSAFLAASREARALLDGRINEVLMVGPDGAVLEGLSSNFFGVRGATLWTAEEGVLPGLTRALVLEEAARAGIPLRLEAVAARDLPSLDEAFLSSTSRAVLPVVEVDGQPIGSGRPGPLTRQLAARYKVRLQNEINSVCEPS